MPSVYGTRSKQWKGDREKKSGEGCVVSSHANSFDPPFLKQELNAEEKGYHFSN